MSHDLYASWATTELASCVSRDPSFWFTAPPTPGSLSSSATRERTRTWPISDGVLTVETTAGNSYDIAVELKRENEGLHGLLTAIGQSHAYIHKGFAASIIVIPEKYSSHNSPGEHVSEILTATSANLPIGVYSYKEPDINKPSPFAGLLECHRPIELDGVVRPGRRTGVVPSVTTQWGHVREGSSDAHGFFLYLEVAKRLKYVVGTPETYDLPQEMIDAVEIIETGADPIKYLSNSIGDDFHDRVWRAFWFRYILSPSLSPIWRGTSRPYIVNDQVTKILVSDGAYKKFFFGRTDSIKSRLVRELTDCSISEQDAWQQYIANVRNRAHSYREDIDSGLEALGLLASDGKPSELGYRFVDHTERTGTPLSGTANAILGAALLKNANFSAFLHYIYRLSADKFAASPLEFCVTMGSGPRFASNEYLAWLANQLADQLKVMRTVSLRGGRARKPFQAELAILRKFGCVTGFRLGLGLEINWPKVQEYMDFKI